MPPSPHLIRIGVNGLVGLIGGRLIERRAFETTSAKYLKLNRVGNGN